MKKTSTAPNMIELQSLIKTYIEIDNYISIQSIFFSSYSSKKWKYPKCQRMKILSRKLAESLVMEMNNFDHSTMKVNG